MDLADSETRGRSGSEVSMVTSAGERSVCVGLCYELTTCGLVSAVSLDYSQVHNQ